jgi:hypothetical protein
MKPPVFKRDIVLAVHPSATGMGWTAFEGPLSVHDWAVFTAKLDKNAKCLAKLDKLLRRFEPAVLVLEMFKDGPRRRTWRVRKLCRDMVKLAAERGVHVEIYGRDEVAAGFSQFGVGTREGIATAVAFMIEGFEHRLPPPRRAWMSEDPRMALFNAAALALTHYRLQSDLVLRDKRR